MKQPVSSSAESARTGRRRRDIAEERTDTTLAHRRFGEDQPSLPSLRDVIRVDAATVLLQGGRRIVLPVVHHSPAGGGVGYGWLLRGTYLLLAVAAAAAGFQFGVVPVREASSIAVATAAFAVALLVSVVRRKAGVSGQTDEHDRRERVAAMTGIERGVAQRHGGHEFPPVLDLMAPLLAIPGLVAALYDAGGNLFVSLLRTFAGAAFLGSVTDAMLLGHWYLVQPGLPLSPHRSGAGVGLRVPVEIIALLLPIGMFSAWSGSVNDGWGGQLGWFWAACAITTMVLVVVTKAALMSATTRR